MITQAKTYEPRFVCKSVLEAHSEDIRMSFVTTYDGEDQHAEISQLVPIPDLSTEEKKQDYSTGMPNPCNAWPVGYSYNDGGVLLT